MLREMEAVIDTSPIENLNQPIVWLSDPFCFTPWYTAALAQSLIDTGVKLRLICGEVAREPGYFAAAGLHTEPGPVRLSSALSGTRPLHRALCTLQVMMNTRASLSSIKSERYKPDILHLQQMPLLNHGVHTDFLQIKAASRAGIPVIHTVHNVLPHDSGDRLRATYTRLYNTVDHLVCHSESAATRLRKEFAIPAQRISVISHGPLFVMPEEPTPADSVRARASLGLPIDRPIVLWQGVLAPYKGIDVLLDAWWLLLRRWRPRYGPEPLLVIAGTGPAELMASAIKYSALIGPSVRTDLRYISTTELPNYYKAADLLVYPYSSITTSGALLTGLSYAKPIVASDLPCFRDYLSNGENALLIKPGNADKLATALASLLMGRACPEDPVNGAYARLLRGAASNRRRYTNWAEIGLQTRALYDALLAQRKTRACA
jgi:glycosyltransferase involved in cell wall biosynthesis